MSWWRRPAVLAGLIIAVILGGVVVFVVARHSGADQPATAAQDGPVVHTAAEAAEGPNLSAVSALLTGLPTAFAAGRKDGLTAAAAKQFADLRTALPPGATVAVHTDTWRRAGTLGSIAVTITAPKTPAASYVAVLTQEPTGWKLASTQRAS
jgi:ABC-type sulfate transport system permease component